MRKWNTLRSNTESGVVCIACGDTIDRSEAREYDKHGDRWERSGKRFEYLCKPCDKACCHQPRDGLESILIEAEAGATTRDVFLREFHILSEQHEEAPSET